MSTHVFDGMWIFSFSISKYSLSMVHWALMQYLKYNWHILRANIFTNVPQVQSVSDIKPISVMSHTEDTGQNCFPQFFSLCRNIIISCADSNYLPKCFVVWNISRNFIFQSLNSRVLAMAISRHLNIPLKCSVFVFRHSFLFSFQLCPTHSVFLEIPHLAWFMKLTFVKTRAQTHSFECFFWVIFDFNLDTPPRKWFMISRKLIVKHIHCIQ